MKWGPRQLLHQLARQPGKKEGRYSSSDGGRAGQGGHKVCALPSPLLAEGRAKQRRVHMRAHQHGRNGQGQQGGNEGLWRGEQCVEGPDSNQAGRQTDRQHRGFSTRQG
jgi:hypothetical protein